MEPKFQKDHLATIINALSNIQFKDVSNPEVRQNIAVVGATIDIAKLKYEAIAKAEVPQPEGDNK